LPLYLPFIGSAFSNLNTTVFHCFAKQH